MNSFYITSHSDMVFVFIIDIIVFHTNGNWQQNVPVHPGMIPHKLQNAESYRDDRSSSGASKQIIIAQQVAKVLLLFNIATSM